MGTLLSETIKRIIVERVPLNCTCPECGNEVKDVEKLINVKETEEWNNLAAAVVIAVTDAIAEYFSKMRKEELRKL